MLIISYLTIIIVSLNGKNMRDKAFPKQSFIGSKLFGANLRGDVLHRGTNDQLMAEGGAGQFHKCIFC